MKKILQLTTAAVLLFTAAESKAQLADGSIAPDWTFTDLGGTSHNLYTYLDAGKTVFIDVSAAWCAPCWSYHNSHALRDLYENHGPAGYPSVVPGTTDDVMVFFIEGEDANTTAQLYGPAATGSTAVATQGDWVAGTTYPIIDPAASAINSFNSQYAIGYFPTIYMICPDRSVTEVGQLTTANLYAAKSSCSVASAPLDAQMMLSTSLNSFLASCDSVTPTFRLGNVGTSTLTSATITYKVDGITQKVFPWTGSLATYANTTVTGVKVGATTSGSHTITAEISDPNGSADPTMGNNSTTASFIKYSTTGGAAVAETFEGGGIPSSWPISNAGNALTWEDATVGYSSSASMKVMWYNIPSGDVDMIILEAQDFTSATSPRLKFDVAYRQYTTENDRLQVEVSTNCGTTWTSVYNKAGSTLATQAASTTSFVPSSASQWRSEYVTLPAYAGMAGVLVRFKATSGYGNNLYVDNINFSPTSVGIEESEAINNINVYPNPMANAASVDFNLTEANEVSMVMMNTVGQVISTENLGSLSAGNHSYSLDATSLSNGLYFLNITIGSSTITKKVSVHK